MAVPRARLDAFIRMTGPGSVFDVEVPEFFKDALCPQTDPEAFFPSKGGSTRDAKRICKGCPVREQCLAWALGENMRFGIWGGLSERERRKLERAA